MTAFQRLSWRWKGGDSDLEATGRDAQAHSLGVGGHCLNEVEAGYCRCPVEKYQCPQLQTREPHPDTFLGSDGLCLCPPVPLEAASFVWLFQSVTDCGDLRSSLITSLFISGLLEG